MLPLQESFANTGIAVDGGAGTAVNPVLFINVFNVPASATAMAVFVEDALTQASTTNNTSTIDPGAVTDIWQPVSSQVVQPVAIAGLKTVQVQFRNSDNDLSPVFQQVIYYDPFPNGLISFATSAVSGTANPLLVNVGVQAPTTAWAMRFATDPTSIKGVEKFQDRCRVGVSWNSDCPF